MDSDSVRGNYSLQAFYTNATKAFIRLDDIGPLDCSEGGYNKLFFRIKWANKDGEPPSSNATIKLISGSENNYFSSSITENISRNSGEWANLTVSIGPKSEGWTSTGSPNWSYITGLQFELNWFPSKAEDLKVKIDDLFFGGVEYAPLLEKGSFVLLASVYLTSTLIDLFINWFILTVILLVLLKFSGFKSATWKPLFIAAGYTFSPHIVEYALNVLLISMLPHLYLPFEVFNPVIGEEIAAQEATSHIYSEKWFPTWQFQVSGYLFYIFNAWAAILVAVALRFLFEMNWKKAISTAVVSYLMAFILRGLVSPL